MGSIFECNIGDQGWELQKKGATMKIASPASIIEWYKKYSYDTKIVTFHHL